MIPNDWKIMSLGEICSNHLQTGPFGSQLHSHEYVENGIPVLMPKDLNDYRADLSSAAKITPKKANDLKKHILKKGDLLFSRRGDVARFALIDEKSEGSICGTGCLKARPNENHSSKFLAYFLQKDSVKQWLEQNAVGQTMPNMNTEILRELPLISASSRKEEEKIAEILSTWDKAIETVEKLVANSQQQKKALMQQLLTGQKRLLDENGVKFGDEWEKTNLKNLLKEEKARNRDKAITRVLSVTNHSGFVLPENHFSKRVASDEVSNYKVVKKGQFGYNPSRINVGSFARLDDFDSGILSPMYVVFEISTPKLDSDFFNFWMQSHEAKQRINNSTQGSVRDSVGFDAMASFPFKLPTIKEQEKIAQVLTLADREIDLYNQQLDKLKLEKKSLMQQLLTGQKRVKI
ncbi:restriction endonuclease subunit S [Moraxella osloensis]|uniref:Restriction endonuclease subunit S n=1 Tax=Faucicola osloensis TaxID=34062 RepID=A0AAD0AX36_FAUOS|nr:restriction endonuclease subunit S [Moraxella osloensis]ATW70749.1 restriction endonuclease subunit S [Moraxella osloensis]ATY49450.1 restriction endonuclease subunit S [Moraxella osloensis]